MLPVRVDAMTVIEHFWCPTCAGRGWTTSGYDVLPDDREQCATCKGERRIAYVRADAYRGAVERANHAEAVAHGLLEYLRQISPYRDRDPVLIRTRDALGRR